MALAAAPEISGFRALSPLGYGPTSTIYSAQADALGRWVALTVYSTSLPNERARRRFSRSFEVARRLGSHPHVVTMLENGCTFDGQPYVATEIYERGTLQTRVEGRNPLTVDEVLHMGIQLAGALETAHRAEVVHGGIHPARVLLSHDGEPALADLGMVPLVDRGGLAALVSPMSFHAPPEVLEARPLTPATDVYALASSLYAALSGRAPYQRGDDDTTAALLVRILQHDVPRLERSDVPASLEEALRRALRSEPEQRPSRVLAFGRELQSCQKELGLPVTEPVLLDLASGIQLAGLSIEPRLELTPVVEPAPPSSPSVQRVFVPAPEDIPDPVVTPPDPPSPSAGPADPFPPFNPPAAERAAEPFPVFDPPARAAEPVADPFPPFDPPSPQPAQRAEPFPHFEPPAPSAERAAEPFPHFEPPAPSAERAAEPFPHVEPPAAQPAGDGVRSFDSKSSWGPTPRTGDDHHDRATGPSEEPEAPPTVAPPMRALPVIVLVALVVVLGAGLAWAVTTSDPEDTTDPDAGAAAPPADDDQAPTHVDVTAVENPSGVQLDWDGGSGDDQVVLVLSETERPRLLPAETGTALLVPGNSLAARTGYCFAVTTTSDPSPAPALLAADLPDDALTPAACIRGASPASVRRS